MPIYALDEFTPQLPPDGAYFIADSAVVIGKVTLKKGANVWFGAVIRGDEEFITLEEGANVQDNSTLHADPGSPLTIGEYALVGHNVILHGCTIGAHCLIGMGAIIMNGAILGRECVVGAGAIIPEGKEFEPRSLIIGAPAKVIRTLDDETFKRFSGGAARYVANSHRFKRGLRKIG